MRISDWSSDVCSSDLVLRRQLTEKGTMSSVVRVDEVREFDTKFRLRSAGGGWRVAIVDEAERMNRNAENALLKILEEPPANTLIILVSNALNAMLPTTRSRCRRLVLRSEEHTSELQSLLRISYAVFCL